LGSLTRAYNFTQLALLVYLTLPMYLWYCTGLLYGYKEATGISIAYAWGLWLNFSTINRFSISFFLPLEITLMMLLIVTIAFYSLKIKNFNFTALLMFLIPLIHLITTIMYWNIQIHGFYIKFTVNHMTKSIIPINAFNFVTVREATVFGLNIFLIQIALFIISLIFLDQPLKIYKKSKIYIHNKLIRGETPLFEEFIQQNNIKDNDAKELFKLAYSKIYSQLSYKTTHRIPYEIEPKPMKME